MLDRNTHVNCFISASSLWLVSCGFVSEDASVSKFQIQEAAPQPSNQGPSSLDSSPQSQSTLRSSLATRREAMQAPPRREGPPVAAFLPPMARPVAPASRISE
ncbi:hypothetical protein V8F20_003100 [Naviculisporaceae sp. PSN 640]